MFLFIAGAVMLGLIAWGAAQNGWKKRNGVSKAAAKATGAPATT